MAGYHLPINSPWKDIREPKPQRGGRLAIPFALALGPGDGTCTRLAVAMASAAIAQLDRAGERTDERGRIGGGAAIDSAWPSVRRREMDNRHGSEIGTDLNAEAQGKASSPEAGDKET